MLHILKIAIIHACIRNLKEKVRIFKNLNNISIW